MNKQFLSKTLSIVLALSFGLSSSLMYFHVTSAGKPPTRVIEITSPTAGQSFTGNDWVSVSGFTVVSGGDVDYTKYGVKVTWGDSPDSTTSCLPVTSSWAWTTNPVNNHQYVTGGQKTITARLYHQCEVGSEPSKADASTTLNINICIDNDGDGYGQSGSTGCTNVGNDCNDSNPNIHPGTTELCDGLDNNCDISIDEGFNVGQSCIAGIGACQNSGTYVCTQDKLTTQCNAVPGDPSPELCDTLDNDCDGTVDESLTQSTICGLGACSQNTGFKTCTAGNWGNDTCNPYLGAGQEICEGSIDENCNGSVDENCSCTNGATQSCGYNNIGVCQLGTQTCTDGVWGSECVGAINPTTEICDGLDNNCDGSIDEGFNVGQSCTVGIGACQNSGTYVCTQDGSTTECNTVPGEPSPELCDNLDNNCDGTVDDFTRSTSCGLGVCSSNVGIETCTAGYWSEDTCDPYHGATREVCEGQLDENCDGTIDEGCGCTNGATLQCGPQTDVGECTYGTQICTNGTWGECIGAVYSIDEICDGLDNDCDGLIDNAGADCPAAPSGFNCIDYQCVASTQGAGQYSALASCQVACHSTTTTTSAGAATGFGGQYVAVVLGAATEQEGAGQVAGASTACNPYLLKFIKLGANNDPEEVKKLESFLNEYLGVNLPINGIYEEVDYNAVKQFQLFMKDDVLAPWVLVGCLPSDITPTGYVYRTTEWAINNMFCPIPKPDVSDEKCEGGIIIGLGEEGTVLGESTTTPTTTTETTPPETTETTVVNVAPENGVNPSQNWIWYLIGIIIIGGAVYLVYSKKSK